MTKTIHAECCGFPDTHGADSVTIRAGGDTLLRGTFTFTPHLRRRRYYFEWIKNEPGSKNFEGGPISVKKVV